MTELFPLWENRTDKKLTLTFQDTIRQILKLRSQVSQFVNYFRYFKRQLKGDFFKLAAAINIILPFACDHDSCELKRIAGYINERVGIIR